MRTVKKYFLGIILFPFSMFYSQVGIGTTSPASSAILDINVSSISPKKGFLLPRVNLLSSLDVSTIVNPANSLMVFNRTASGSGSTAVAANRIYTWSQGSWNSFSNITEISNMKVPVNFALSSLNQQQLTSAQITSLNSSGANVVPVNWNSTDIIVDNPTDVNFVSPDKLRILTAGFYLIRGMANLRITPSTNGAATYSVIALQLSQNEGTSWTDIASYALPFEDFASDKVQSAVFPSIVYNFSQNDLIRLVISKPGLSGVGNYSTSATTTGLIVSHPGVDITKSFRISRLPQ